MVCNQSLEIQKTTVYAAMLKENKITNKRKANEILLRLKFHQHGQRDVTWQRSVVFMSHKKNQFYPVFLIWINLLGFRRQKFWLKQAWFVPPERLWVTCEWQSSYAWQIIFQGVLAIFALSLGSPRVRAEITWRDVSNGLIYRGHAVWQTAMEKHSQWNYINNKKLETEEPNCTTWTMWLVRHGLYPFSNEV